ncbi:MAG: DUF4440 domain-containing protein [Candidatus Bathyarchaeota archaeon]|nr:DUF4440 domain-containing protein [Candidatus Bathyarchaeota archaeon]
MAEEIQEAIKKADLKFGECVRAGDAAALAALYTEDACLMPANFEMIRGREAVKEFWGGAISGLGLKDAILTTIELIGVGDTVTELGEYRLKIQPEGQEPVEDKGKYVVVWKQTDEGWKLHWDIWNTSLPAQ